MNQEKVTPPTPADTAFLVTLGPLRLIITDCSTRNEALKIARNLTLQADLIVFNTGARLRYSFENTPVISAIHPALHFHPEIEGTKP